MRGNTGTMMTTNYRTIPVVSSFTPLAIQGLKWGLIAEIDEREVIAPVKKLAKAAIGWGLVLIFMLIIFSILVVRMTVAPLKYLITGMRGIVRKKDINLQGSLEAATSDEVGEVSVLINAFIDELRKKITAVSMTKKELRAAANTLVKTVDALEEQDTTVHGGIDKNIQSCHELSQQSLNVLHAMNNFQQGIEELGRTIEQLGALAVSRLPAHTALTNHMNSMQEREQKLVALCEKEIFDLRQALRYCEENNSASAKALLKTTIADVEQGAAATRITLSTLQQTGLLLEEERLASQKMGTILATLQKHIANAQKEGTSRIAVLQQWQGNFVRLIEEVRAVQELSKESLLLIEALKKAVTQLDTGTDDLDNIIKRFSW